jgi:hypothetical protein
MSQERVNRVIQVLGWLGRVWNVVLLGFSVAMVLFLLTLIPRGASFGGILFGIGVFTVIATMCITDLRRKPEHP